MAKINIVANAPKRIVGEEHDLLQKLKRFVTDTYTKRSGFRFNAESIKYTYLEVSNSLGASNVKTYRINVFFINCPFDFKMEEGKAYELMGDFYEFLPIAKADGTTDLALFNEALAGENSGIPSLTEGEKVVFVDLERANHFLKETTAQPYVKVILKNSLLGFGYQKENYEWKANKNTKLAGITATSRAEYVKDGNNNYIKCKNLLGTYVVGLKDEKYVDFTPEEKQQYKNKVDITGLLLKSASKGKNYFNFIVYSFKDDFTMSRPTASVNIADEIPDEIPVHIAGVGETKADFTNDDGEF